MCDFCDKYQELKNMEQIRTDEYSITQFRLMSGLVMCHAVRFTKWWNKEFHLEGSFELNYCPECGKKIKENKDDSNNT